MSVFPSRLINDYYSEYSDDMWLACACGWVGPAGKAEHDYREDLQATHCPKCLTVLLVIEHPTTEQMIAAARAGNQEAIENCRVYGVDY